MPRIVRSFVNIKHLLHMGHKFTSVLRWDDPLLLYYPQYVTWFDFPFTVWIGPETSALEKNAALAFQRFLLSESLQEAVLVYGLRPANPNVAVDANPDSLFVKWQDRGVEPVVPRADAMREGSARD